METVEELKEYLRERGYEDSVVLENPSYLSAVIGMTDEGAVCYSYDKMVESLMDEDGMDMEEAIEFIEYNTLRALPYASSMGTRPIVVYEENELPNTLKLRNTLSSNDCIGAYANIGMALNNLAADIKKKVLIARTKENTIDIDKIQEVLYDLEDRINDSLGQITDQKIEIFVEK